MGRKYFGVILDDCVWGGVIEGRIMCWDWGKCKWVRCLWVFFSVFFFVCLINVIFFFFILFMLDVF